MIRELDNESNLIVEMDGKKTSLLKSSVSRAPDNRPHDFTFDHSYWSVNKNDKNYVDQETVFQDLGKPVVDCAFEGYNACVFAYGETTFLINYMNCLQMQKFQVKLGQEKHTQ